MGFLANRNQTYNQSIPLPAQPINGQALGAVSGMKFGLSTMAHCGCEVIAVYNALLLSGCYRPLHEIARYMERYRMLLGFWGTDFLALGRCLKRFGLGSHRFLRRAALSSILQTGTLCIFVYWTGRRFASSVHTVCIRCEPNGLVVWNAHNHSADVLHMDWQTLCEKKMLVAYQIENPL